MIAAASAIALFIIMFIEWFGVDIVGANAWESFSFIDIVLLITILAAIGTAVMSASAQSVNTPVALSAIVTALGILSVLLVLFRIIDPPDFGLGDLADAVGGSEPEIERKIGVFLGLLAALGIAYGGYEAMRHEGTSFGREADRLQNKGGTSGPGGTSGTGTPPPPPPPPTSGTGTGPGSTGTGGAPRV